MKKKQNVSLPDARGHFGLFGGRYVPETLMAALEQLENAYQTIGRSAAFKKELDDLLEHFAGRATPLFYAKELSKFYGGAQIYLKREDLAHTGSHKINNTLGQCLLAKAMGKQRVIAETGAGQHGVASATAAALLKLKCVVYMGKEDVRRQALNVFRMRLLGAQVVEVDSGSCTLKDAVNEAMRDWVTNVRDTFYVLGSAIGPHPYPMMVRDFQSVIGTEAKAQFKKMTGKLPDALVACVGGGSNSIGLFYPFYADKSVKMFGVEAGGKGKQIGQHGASLSYGKPGILHGTLSYILQNPEGQVESTHSISAGLDYPGVGPEHAFYKYSGRARYVAVSDKQALAACQQLSCMEGIIPALESAHAIAYLKTLAPAMHKKQNIIVCLSGRGDKDAMELQTLLNLK